MIRTGERRVAGFLQGLMAWAAICLAALPCRADDVANEYDYFLQSVLGSTMIDDWQKKPVEKWPDQEITVFVKGEGDDAATFAIEMATVLENISVITTSPPILKVVTVAPTKKRVVTIFFGGESQRKAFNTTVRKIDDRPDVTIAQDLRLNITMGGLEACRTVVLLSGHHIVGAFTYIDSQLVRKTQAYCGYLSTLISLGFKGYVTTINPCQSLLCLPPNSVIPRPVDMSSLSLLYSKSIPAGMLGGDAASLVKTIMGK